jgi:hypothetical protein
MRQLGSGWQDGGCVNSRVFLATSVVPGPVGMPPLCHLIGWLKITVVFPNGVVEISQFQDVEKQKKS